MIEDGEKLLLDELDPAMLAHGQETHDFIQLARDCAALRCARHPPAQAQDGQLRY